VAGTRDGCSQAVQRTIVTLITIKIGAAVKPDDR
jgi:hypothetical protein